MTILFEKLENIFIEWKIFNKKYEKKEEKDKLKQRMIQKIYILLQTISIDDFNINEKIELSRENNSFVSITKINSKDSKIYVLSLVLFYYNTEAKYDYQ